MWVISRFKELSLYKNKIMMKLIENQDLVKAIHYNDMDFLSKEDMGDPHSLLYNKIFPYRSNPNLNEVQNTYITMSFGGYSLRQSYYKVGYITFFVFTHFNNMRTDYGVLRTDFILNQIDELFNKSTDFGIGKLKFEGMDDLPVNSEYSGSWIKYKVLEFN